MDGTYEPQLTKPETNKKPAPGIVATPILDAGGAINRNSRAKISFIRSQPRSFLKH
jgi:hypothetical protein